MCGGIIGALSLSLPAEIRRKKITQFEFVLLYNTGRLLSYSAAGLVAGAFGIEILTALGLAHAHVVLRYMGVIFMVLIGFYLAGWFPQLAQLERIGRPVWRTIEPFARKLMPINTPLKALTYGVAWGWLPCGLVYVVLLMAITAGSALQGASMMLAFGLGTLPSMMSAGIMASWISRFSRSALTRQIIGLLIITLAMASLFIGGGDAPHHH
jgi:hypothetical protein